jgi:uncharacterized protein YxjI
MSSLPPPPPPAWHPDPTGRHQYRYWDGTVWTDHVSDNGATGTDPVNSPAASPAGAGGMAARALDSLDDGLTVGNEGDPGKIQQQLHGTGWRGANVGAAAFEGSGSILDEPILVVNQKAKLIELSNQFSVFNQHGQRIGAVNETGQSTLKKAVRLLTSYDQYLTHRYEVLHANGAVALRLTRPAKLVKSSIIVSNGADQAIGTIRQDNVFGKIHFSLEAANGVVGSIRAENWRAWNFRIEDHTGREVARITKTFEGFLKNSFTTADNYVVQIHERLADPLRSLVVAAAVSIDTALKQDQRGLN